MKLISKFLNSLKNKRNTEKTICCNGFQPELDKKYKTVEELYDSIDYPTYTSGVIHPQDIKRK